MNNLKNLLASLFLILLCNTVFGQSASTKAMTDDLYTRTPSTKGSAIVWNLNQYGYKGTYTISNQDYMTWYDKDGNFLETLLKTDWDDRVPAILRMELDGSEFNTCTVAKYWVSIKTRNDTYFLELIDRDGKSQSAWADENGKLSAVPVFLR